VARRAGRTTLSGFVLTWRYPGDVDRWVGIRMGGGPVPADSFTGAELERLGAFRLALEGRAPLHPRLVVGLEMG
jgi:hypothetical protein